MVEYGEGATLTPEAATLLIVLVAIFSALHQLTDGKRVQRVARRKGTSPDTLSPHEYKRPWLNSLPEMFLTALLGGAFLFGTAGAWLLSELLGFDANNNLYRITQILGGLGGVVFFASKNFDSIQLEREMLRQQADQASRD